MQFIKFFFSITLTSVFGPSSVFPSSCSDWRHQLVYMSSLTPFVALLFGFSPFDLKFLHCCCSPQCTSPHQISRRHLCCTVFFCCVCDYPYFCARRRPFYWNIACPVFVILCKAPNTSFYPYIFWRVIFSSPRSSCSQVKVVDSQWTQSQPETLLVYSTQPASLYAVFGWHYKPLPLVVT
jgi:hypothetical protein